RFRPEYRTRRSAWNDSLELFAAPHAAADLVDHPHQREAHGQFINAGPVQMSGQAEQASASVLGRTERGESGPAVANNRGHGAESLDIVQHGRALERAGYGRERRPDARNTALPFERFEQRRFFADLVCSGAGLRIAIE